MATAGGPKIVTDGLVFGYDNNYGVADNDTATRFYAGEPTNNLLSNVDDWSSGWTGNLFGNWINATVTANAGVAPDGTTTASKLTGGYSRWQRINCSTNTTYTFSFWIKNIDLPIAPQIHIAFGLNGTLVNYNNVTTIALNTIGEWTRVSKTHTSPSSGINQMEVGVTWSSNYPNTDSVLVWHAMCEQKAHSTPFVNGTRSSTASLIDLKETTDISMSNVSFDSTGQPEMDGSSDYIDLGADLAVSPINQGWTAEYVFNSDSAEVLQHFNGCEEDVHNAGWLALYQNKLQVWDRAAGVWKKGDTVFASNTWYHVAFVQETGTSMQFYVNGVAEGGDHVSFAWTAAKSAFFARYIGRYEYGGYSRYFNGHIPVTRLYDKGLSAAEIKQNYNTLKNRFDI
tara:strand:+ start:1 stop:1194 length:1194 start_codon:yes stop_codon:yes gene_type:complete